MTAHRIVFIYDPTSRFTELRTEEMFFLDSAASLAAALVPFSNAAGPGAYDSIRVSGRETLTGLDDFLRGWEPDEPDVREQMAAKLRNEYVLLKIARP